MEKPDWVTIETFNAILVTAENNKILGNIEAAEHLLKLLSNTPEAESVWQSIGRAGVQNEEIFVRGLCGIINDLWCEAREESRAKEIEKNNKIKKLSDELANLLINDPLDIRLIINSIASKTGCTHRAVTAEMTSNYDFFVKFLYQNQNLLISQVLIDLSNASEKTAEEMRKGGEYASNFGNSKKAKLVRKLAEAFKYLTQETRATAVAKLSSLLLDECIESQYVLGVIKK